jgi:hypothetical protein
MNPLSQDQVAAVERAADDVDRYHGCVALMRRRRDVADWSIWELVVVQGVPVRRAADVLHLKRGLVRMAIGRVSAQLKDDPAPELVQPAPQLYPPLSWEENELR